MKKLFFLLFSLTFSVVSHSQGIEFTKGTWNEILSKAQQTGKPIFVDIYTTWCGPCKRMDKEIFVQEIVGKAYNSNFICCQIDAEKGEGIELSKKYGVRAFPTYLFIKPDGELFYKAMGYRQADNFIEVSKTALEELKDTKSLEEWDKEYATNKNNKQFLLAYMDKRERVGLSNIAFFDEYLKSLPDSEDIPDDVIKRYQTESSNMTIDSYTFEYLLKNRDAFSAKLFQNADLYIQNVIMKTVQGAARSKNDQLFAKAIAAYDQLPEDISVTNPSVLCRDEIYMYYYQRRGNISEYVKYATNFCDRIMKMSPDSLKRVDEQKLQMIESQEKDGLLAQLDAAQIAALKRTVARYNQVNISTKLNNTAWEIFKSSSDKNTLEKALKWSEGSLRLWPENANWMDTYANLLYKLGRKEEAINKQKEAVSLAVGDFKTSKLDLEKSLQKMINGE